MFTTDGYNSSSQNIELSTFSGGGKIPFGNDFIVYQFFKVRNVANLQTVNSYLVRLSHTIRIPGIPTNIANGGVTQFSNYPVYLNVSSAINASEQGMSVRLRSIFPRTLNASVDSTSNQSQGTSSSSSNEHTAGSANSTVNTFGVSLGGGFFGEIPMGNASVDHSHSSGYSQSQASSQGMTSGQATNADSGTQMSIKDWASYGRITNINGSSSSAEGQGCEWVWGQAYPWDVLQFNKTQGGVVTLPAYVQDRLVSDGVLLPPSHLSTYGLNFVMTAEWEVTFPDEIATPENISFTHNVSLLTASHSLNGGTVKVTLNTSTMSSDIINTPTPYDLGSYALSPLAFEDGNSAGISFESGPFDITPNNNSAFKITAPSNMLLATGEGFDAPMTTTFSGQGGAAQVTLTFKCSDASSDVSLLFRHWVGEGSGPCLLKCSINGNWTDEILVDQEEGRGARNNMDRLELRNLDLSSSNYHDYVRVGMNNVVITITPQNSSAQNNSYCLSAAGIA